MAALGAAGQDLLGEEETQLKEGQTQREREKREVERVSGQSAVLDDMEKM